MGKRDVLIEIFEDTMKMCQEEETLIQAVKQSIEGTRLYKEEEYPELSQKPDSRKTKVTVTKYRTFQSAMLLKQENPDKKIAVHNFASGISPGGGVRSGSTAQEECLCRCSTLYPVLKIPMLKKNYYDLHKKGPDTRFTDTCIYTPGVYVVKTDTDTPERLEKKKWYQVAVLTCPAPNLRVYTNVPQGAKRVPTAKLTDRELLELHKKRARHMLTIAASQNVDILVLGAFGCGAFQNNPEVVARAYKEILEEFQGRFEQIEFAVFCTPKDTRNYEVFKRVFATGK